MKEKNANVKLDPYSPEGRKKAKQYAWMTTFGGAILSMVSVGIGVSSFSLFYRVLLETYNATVQQISLFSTVQSIGTIFLIMFSGYYIEKFSFKVVTFIGILSTTIEMILIAVGPGLPTLYLAAVFTAISQATAGFGVTLAIPSRWFAKKAALPTNITKIGSSVATIIMSPILASVITNYGLRSGGLLAAGVTLVLGSIASLFLVRKCPEDYGLVPVGAEKPSETQTQKEVPVPAGLSQAEAMRKAQFWIILLTTGVCFGVATSGISPQISNIMAERGFDLIQVGTYNSIRSAAALVLGFVNSYLMDRLGYRPTFAIMGTVFVGSLVVLRFANTFPMMICYALMWIFAGPCSSNWMPIALSNMFGRKAISGLQGINSVIGNIGSALGPIIVPAIYAATGSYETAILAMIPFAVIGILGGLFATQKKYTVAASTSADQRSAK